MEHFRSPFCANDFAAPSAIQNRTFFEGLLARAGRHPFFSHPFISTAARFPLSRNVVSSILTSFYKIVSPFTGLLCALGGRSPTLKCRFALMDNIYEEMGCGDLESAHPSLYLKMLASIGVSAEAAEAAPTLSPIRQINDHLAEIVERQPFCLACAVLASAEATIPPSFPVLAAMAHAAFPVADMTFFDRHGTRDEGHANDAAALFVLTADSSHFDAVEVAVQRDLDRRSELFDEWMASIAAERLRSPASANQAPQFGARRAPAQPSALCTD